MDTYRIEVEGEVDAARLPLLDQADVAWSSGRTVIEVACTDASHLWGVLASLRDLGLELTSLSRT